MARNTYAGSINGRKPDTSESRPGRKDLSADVIHICECLAALREQALAHLSRDRIIEFGRRLSRGVTNSQAIQDPLLGGVLVGELALCSAPQPGRTSPFERLAKQLKPAKQSLEARLLSGLIDLRFTMFSVSGAPRQGAYPAVDLLTNRSFTILDPYLSNPGNPRDVRFGAWLVPVGDAWLIASALVVISDRGLEALAAWRTRDGQRWTNPTRAAEALYRHVLDKDEAALWGMEAAGRDEEVDDLVVPDEPLDELASRWSKRDPGVPATPDEEQFVRSMAGDPDTVFNAVISVSLARSNGASRLAGAYQRILELLVDTLMRRIAVGRHGARDVLAKVEDALASAIAARVLPDDMRVLFERLKRRVADAGEDPDLEKLRNRIKVLRERTVDRGCTEAEALAAAEKVAELLDRYGLSLSECEMRSQTCEGFGIDTGRKRQAPIDDCLPVIAGFCGCRSWYEVTPDKTYRLVFFGLPADVTVARYLYDLIAATLAHQTAEFKCSDMYMQHPVNYRGQATRSFQAGLSHRIMEKLTALTRERTGAGAGGRDLVPVRDAMIDAEMDKLGLTFQAKSNGSSRRFLSHAYGAGHEAGAGFEYRLGLTSSGGAGRNEAGSSSSP